MKNYILKNIFTVHFVLVMSCALYACTGEQYAFQTFTYPDSIQAHEKGWEYRGQVKFISSVGGSMFRKSNKEVNITVYDKYGNQILNDAYDFIDVSGLKANVNWGDKNILKIDIIEYGSNEVDDLYSKNLAQTGEKIIDNYIYTFINDGKKLAVRK